MRLAFALALAAGCYSPTVPGNVPCDPNAPHCPAGQTCMGIPGAAVCSATALSSIDAPSLRDTTPLDAPDPDAAIDARQIDAAIMIDAKLDAAMIMPDAMPDATMMMPDATMVDAQIPPVHLDYAASVAQCLDPAMPDLTSCTMDKGASQLAVDGLVSTPGTTFSAYLRFDLDGQLAGHNVMVVTLNLTNTGVSGAESAKSGEVWSVAAFTMSSLATAAPAKLGTAPIAPAQANIALGQAVTFALPVGLVGPNQSLYLGMYTDISDGVQYWDNTGAVPPRLHIDAQ